MVKRGDKRGSHVGVVISFAIFVTFIIFIYAIAQPGFNKEQKEESLMAYLEKTLIENSSDYLTIMTLNVSTNTGKECIQLDGFMNNFDFDNNLVVRNQEGDFAESAVAINKEDLRITRDDNLDKFFKVYYSENFDYVGHGSDWDCEKLSEGAAGYSLGVTKNETYVFEEKIYTLLERYDGWYDDFKDRLGIPRNFEFGFGLVYSNGSVVETENIDLSKDIYVKEVPIQYVSTQGKIESGFLKLKTW
jgi:hypothetical protein